MATTVHRIFLCFYRSGTHAFHEGGRARRQLQRGIDVYIYAVPGMSWDTNKAKRCRRHSDAHAARLTPGGLSCVLGNGDHERRHRASPVRPAADRPGHGGAGAPAGPRPPRGAPRHAARLPPLRHGGALRHRGAHRGGRRRGRAHGGRRLPRRALRHLQGLVRRRPPRQGAPGPPPDAQVPCAPLTCLFVASRSPPCLGGAFNDLAFEFNCHACLPVCAAISRWSTWTCTWSTGR